MEALFSIGQRVVCVDSTDHHPEIEGLFPPIIEGKTYPVKDLKQCVCGLIFLDVGLAECTYLNLVFTCSCSFQHQGERRFLCEQTRFVPLDDDRVMDEQIRESLNLHLIER
jgi:hypothetical protein